MIPMAHNQAIQIRLLLITPEADKKTNGQTGKELVVACAVRAHAASARAHPHAASASAHRHGGGREEEKNGEGDARAHRHGGGWEEEKNGEGDGNLTPNLYGICRPAKTSLFQKALLYTYTFSKLLTCRPDSTTVDNES
jgi:hypothetical protein